MRATSDSARRIIFKKENNNSAFVITAGNCENEEGMKARVDTAEGSNDCVLCTIN